MAERKDIGSKPARAGSTSPKTFAAYAPVFEPQTFVTHAYKGIQLHKEPLHYTTINYKQTTYCTQYIIK